MKTLQECRDLVWQYRDKLSDVWPTPPRDDAIRFAACEAAEALDAWLRRNPKYARNNDKDLSVRDELADCAIMLITALGEDDFEPGVENKWQRYIMQLGADIYKIEEISTLVFEATRGNSKGYRDVFLSGLSMALNLILRFPEMELYERIEKRLQRIEQKNRGAA